MKVFFIVLALFLTYLLFLQVDIVKDFWLDYSQRIDFTFNIRILNKMKLM